MENKLILVTGGASSGKSAFAENLIIKSGYSKRIYIATMRPFDDETIKRIERHHKLREQKNFETVEIYGEIFDGLDEKTISDKAVLLECMSNYLNNMLFDINGIKGSVENTVDKMKNDIIKLKKYCKYTVIVTNEIFSDGNQYSYETEEYIKALGRINIEIAKIANEVYEVVCGIPLEVKRVDN